MAFRKPPSIAYFSRYPLLGLLAGADRAAQFSPFAALTDQDAAIAEAARLTDESVKLEIYHLLQEAGSPAGLAHESPSSPA